MGFFDKLKKEITASPVAPETRKEEKKPLKVAPKKAKKPASRVEEHKLPAKEEAVEEKPSVIKPKREEKADFEGELAVDVYETDGSFIIQSTIAGVKAEDLDITIENDIVTVRGSREKQVSEETKKYYYQECYWGAFSRQVMLPEEVDGSKAEANIKDGVLTLKIPKAEKIQKRKISIKQEE